MTPDDLRARMKALGAAAKALLGDMAEQVSFDFQLMHATDAAINLMHEAGAGFDVIDGRLVSADHADYMSIRLYVDGCSLGSYHDIPTVLRPPPGYVPPEPPPAPVIVTPPAPSLPNLRDLEPSDASIRFSLLEMD